MAQERRRSPRFTIRQLIEIDYGKESYLRAEGINISRSGLLCTTEPEISPSSRVFLSLDFPGNDPINCEGFVVRSKPHGASSEVAINFTEFKENDAERFVELFEKWEREQGAAKTARKAK